MKIGIVTQPLSRNYGGILQNYALQQRLKALGHTPYTFDLGQFGWCDMVETNIKSIVKLLIGRPTSFVATPKHRELSERPLRRFVEERISLITPRSKRPSVAKVMEYGLDALIVGSDQVWRPRYNYSIEDMYLAFAKELNIKRIAYAASFGTDKWEYSYECQSRCGELLRMFDAISVREDAAVGLCKEHFSVEAKHVLDPTLLLTAEEYNSLTTTIPQRKRPILFAYLLDRSEQMLSFVHHEAERQGLTAVVVGAGEELKANDSIELWLSYFRDAQYVITDSFHGCAFSIIFNREFRVLGNAQRGNSRMESLLRAFCIEDRYGEVHSSEPIDWERINSRLAELRAYSEEFLLSSLNK